MFITDFALTSTETFLNNFRASLLSLITVGLEREIKQVVRIDLYVLIRMYLFDIFLSCSEVSE